MSVLHRRHQDNEALPIVIAGGGVAALEAGLALRSVAHEDLAIELVCPAEKFEYRPLSVLGAFRDTAPQVVEMKRFADEQGVTLHSACVTAVRPDAYELDTSLGQMIGYRALLICAGAHASPSI